jgi:hypothetical protein
MHYGYLWHDQHRRGLEEGTKDRPCVIVLGVTQDQGEAVVLAAPVTHAPPAAPGEAVEIPAATKNRLGLDSKRSWIVTTEVNRFRWPGHDLRRLPGAPAGTYHYGVLPPGLFRQVKTAVLGYARAQRLRITPR